VTTKKYAAGFALTLALAGGGLYTLTAGFEGTGKVQGASKSAFMNFMEENTTATTVAYRDPIGIPTICFGTTVYPNGQKVKMGDTATQAQCRAYMAHHYETRVRPLMEKYVTAPVSEKQAAALAYNFYNLGSGLAWNAKTQRPTQFITALNAGRCRDAVRHLQSFVFAGGTKLPGLVKVREKTGAMLLEDCDA
jgi:GH24 family phage-related lysozyme (muramidase)